MWIFEHLSNQGIWFKSSTILFPSFDIGPLYQDFYHRVQSSVYDPTIQINAIGGFTSYWFYLQMHRSLCLFNIIIRLSLRNGYENEHSTDFYLLYFSEKQCALVLSKPHWSPYKRIQATGFLKLSNVSNAIPINAFEKRVSVFGPFFSTKNYTSLKEDNFELVFSMNQTSNLLLEFFSYPFTFASKIHLENWWKYTNSPFESINGFDGVPKKSPTMMSIKYFGCFMLYIFFFVKFHTSDTNFSSKKWVDSVSR